MTCPSFSDRDQALRDQMAAAQQKLRADMRRSTDPRWHLLPVEPVKAHRNPIRIPWRVLGASAVIVFLIDLGRCFQ